MRLRVCLGSNWSPQTRGDGFESGVTVTRFPEADLHGPGFLFRGTDSSGSGVVTMSVSVDVGLMRPRKSDLDKVEGCETRDDGLENSCALRLWIGVSTYQHSGIHNRPSGEAVVAEMSTTGQYFLSAVSHLLPARAAVVSLSSGWALELAADLP